MKAHKRENTIAHTIICQQSRHRYPILRKRAKKNLKKKNTI
jgi:hypothetical protein